MSAASCPISLHQLPPELRQAVAQGAADDAERVAAFLDALGLRPSGEGTARVPLRLPTYFLVGLGAALRLLAWEQRGLRVHREAGLPPAHEALRNVFRAVAADAPLAEKEQAARRLRRRVLGVFIARLAWDGRALLGADVELGEADEDTLIDALAQFLWQNRHDGDGAAPTEGGRP
jgi:hypothetical protein